MTSRELYNKIRWDQRIDASRVTVGYEDRFRGVLEMPFADQRVGADVPWHRIVHFCFDGKVVWDRQGTENLELLIGEQASIGSDCFRWDSTEERWIAQEAIDDKLWNSEVKLVSWNLLFDLYDDRVPRSHTRIPSFLEQLQECEADIICLQEVTPDVADWLLQDSWVRSTYFSSVVEPEAVLTPYGPLILSKLPAHFKHRALTAGKSIVHGVFAHQSGPIHLLNLHLFSDRKADAEKLRKAQVREALAYVEPEADCWLVGDFNMRRTSNIEGFADVWELLETEDPGYTYDPVRNSLASLTTTTHRAARFDRVLCRGRWTPKNSRVLRQAQPSSDHYPLEVMLYAPVAEKPIHQSALVVIPPEDQWDGIQGIRKDHDKGYERWMPHINLLYGFVPEKHFGQATQLLTSRLKSRPAFEVRLREYKRFHHKQSTTIWLEPECKPKGSLRDLQKELESLFPECCHQSSHGPDGFTPHLTVASIPNGKSSPVLPEIDISFRVDSVQLISRQADTPFEVRESIQLEEVDLLSCLPPFEDREKTSLGIEALCAKQGCKSIVVGSQALNLGLPWSDLDCLVTGHQSAQDFFATLPNGRFVSGRVPLWRMTLHDAKVDIQYAHTSEEHNLESGRSKMELDALLSSHPLENYRELLRQVRCWTHQRVLDNPAFGFPGGWAWTVLVARYAKERSSQDLASFLSWLRSHLEDRPTILSLVEPQVDLAPNLITTTFDILMFEIDRAEHLARRGRWGSLYSDYQPTDTIQLIVKPGGNYSLEECEGWLNGRLVRLLVDCEKNGDGRFRPHRLRTENGILELSLSPIGKPSESIQSKFFDHFVQWYGPGEPSLCSWS